VFRLDNDESQILDDLYEQDNKVSNAQFIKSLKNVKPKI